MPPRTPPGVPPAAQPRSPGLPSSLSPDPAQAGFLTALAAGLGLPPAQAAAFAAHPVLAGPAGLACRLAWQGTGADLRVRPEIHLPIELAAIGLQGLRGLLEAQHALARFGWSASLSDEGLPWLAPLQWSALPDEVAQAMDIGQVLGCLVADQMLQPDAPPSFPSVPAAPG
jgi:hypothetical protein